MTENRFNRIYIQKRTMPEWLTLFIFIFPFMMALLTEVFQLPGFVKYFVDAAYVIAFLFLFMQKQTVLGKKIMPFFLFAVSFFLYTFIVHLFNFQSVFYYLWGFRNNFRFYIAFLLFTTFLAEEDMKKCLKIMEALFWINAVVSVFQFAILGYEQDHLGGIFGVEKGCNAFTIIYFSIVIGKSILSFMSRTEKALLCFSKCAVSLVVAAMAELKIFFIIFPFILVVSALITRFSFRKLALMLASSVMLIFASMLLTTIFKDDGMLSFNRIIEMVTASNYATAEDLGRFTAIPTISNNILTKPLEKIFGLGLGNCDTSSFAICNTPFYQSHSYLHYEWFSSAIIFLETGYAGLVTYTGFYLFCFFFARKRMKNKTSNELFCQISMLTSLICMIMVFYNSALRTEAAYIAFFALALPFAKSDISNTTENIEAIEASAE